MVVIVFLVLLLILVLIVLLLVLLLILVLIIVLLVVLIIVLIVHFFHFLSPVSIVSEGQKKYTFEPPVFEKNSHEKCSQTFIFT